MPNTRIQDLQALWQELNAAKALSVIRKNKDENEIYTLLEWRRPDNTLYKTSQLSGGESPQYTTRTVTYYGTDGETVLQEYTYELIYDDEDLQGEVPQDA